MALLVVAAWYMHNGTISSMFSYTYDLQSWILNNRIADLNNLSQVSTVDELWIPASIASAKG